MSAASNPRDRDQVALAVLLVLLGRLARGSTSDSDQQDTVNDAFRIADKFVSKARSTP